MRHLFHRPPPHMDDLLELDDLTVESVRLAHKLDITNEDDVPTLFYMTDEGRKLWRFPNGGHIYAVAEILRHLFRYNQDLLCDASTEIFIDDIARLFYSSLLASDKLMRFILHLSYGPRAKNRVSWPGEEDRDEISWCDQDKVQERSLVWSAILEWASTYNELTACFLKHEAFTQRVPYAHYASRLLPILNALFAVKSGANNAQGLNAAFDFFTSFSTFIRDVGYIMTTETTLDLQTMESLPSRHNILRDICEHAPTNKKLESEFDELMAGLPDTQKDCDICLQVFPQTWPISDIDMCMLLGNDDRDQTWITCKGSSLIIEGAFESVPLKMPCGHVFCAGCIKLWLDNGQERVQCPFRDADYGIRRHEAVMHTEEFKREYYEEVRLKKRAEEAWDKILEARNLRKDETARVEDVTDDDSEEFEDLKD